VHNALIRHFIYSYRVVSPEDGQWGAPITNTSWSGMIGQVTILTRLFIQLTSS